MAKTPDLQALNTAAQSLAITSQILAIAIELAVIGGGVYFYVKIKKEVQDKEPEVALIPKGMQLVSMEKKASFKERFDKIKKIFMAVVS